MKKKIPHPYIPNSVPEVKQQMLKEIGVGSIEELYEDIPKSLRFNEKLDLPDAVPSEYALKKHVEGIISRNVSCVENISFLGAGCYQHYVPVICDEISHRSEFLTAYAGEPYEDHGRFQVLFEYQSLMAELLDVEVVNVPTYDWSQAASTSIRMAERITNRGTVLVSETINPERLAVIKNYCQPQMCVETIAHCPKSGMMNLDDLKAKMSSDTAAVYFETPSYLGLIETGGKAVADIVHENGSLCIVGVDPICLGVIKPPSEYGADITCGDVQGLGVHMNFGGALGGFIATRDEEKFVMEYPSRLFGITKTSVEGEYGFGDVAYDRTSFGVREEGKEFVGTAAALWGITAAVYLSLMGPKGMQELGRHILQKSQYAMNRLSKIKGVKVPRFGAPHFKEFVVDFNSTGETVKDLNKCLQEKGILGGKDISSEFEDLKNCALYCVTEIHTKEDIDRLAQALEECIG